MQAVVYAGPGRLELQDRPDPSPGKNQALLAVSHVGVCGTDLLIWEGGLTRVRPPVVLGHEFSARVVSAPADSGFTKGRPVVVEPTLSCGSCFPCQSGNAHVCVRLGLVGIDVDGAAATHVAVPTHRLHAVPEGLSLREAALAEPTAVACHMANRAGVTPDATVLVVGGGPIGILVGLVARATGAALVVVREPNPRRRALAEAVGLATSTPDDEPDQELAVRVGADGFDVAFELTGLGVGLETAIQATRVRGTVLLGGLPHGAVGVHTAPAVMKELELRGSRVYRGGDFAAALELLADGRVSASHLITKVVGLSEAIDGAFAAIRDDKWEMKVLIDVEGDVL
ncbi:zinc-dependent alcohol dehydrogenase [Mycobacterium neglectum]|uniref:zinc-dependent alcohol dehydrogenase n=1 Tax=Mycobacterium neglectum TaxID=242737 RepID=UPI000BFF1A10|nr:alcohol dehydrogenase catalytic domain-containing protein [Mycobacterium neglectum]